jgi:hypothetical protein
MDTPPENTAFAHQAAKLSWVCPIIVFLLNTFGGQVGARVIIELTALLLIIVGLVFGIIALLNIAEHGSKGILAPASVGILINTLFLFIFVTNFTAARAKAKGHADIETSPAAGNGRTNHTMNTFNKDGVQFLYNDQWKVTDHSNEPERASDGSKSHLSRSIAIESPDKVAGIWLSFSPAVTNPSLEEYAKGLILASTGATNAAMERITGKIGGLDQPGLRFHITKRRKDGVLWSGEGDFFRLQNSKRQVIIDSLVVANKEVEPIRPAVRLILDSLKIEGMAPADQVRQGTAGANAVKGGGPASLNVKMIIYKPKDGSALIGNKTVMAGDTLEGFKIMAIDRDSITVQSPAGVKKELRLGDVLK